MKLLDELYEIVREEDRQVAVRLLAGSAIYKGHFPGDPVTPGVCQVGMVQELVQKACGSPLTLREVKNLKFTEVLRPEGDILVSVVFDKLEEDGNLLSVKGTIGVGERAVTKFSLIFEKGL